MLVYTIGCGIKRWKAYQKKQKKFKKSLKNDNKNKNNTKLNTVLPATLETEILETDGDLMPKSKRPTVSTAYSKSEMNFSVKTEKVDYQIDGIKEEKEHKASFQKNITFDIETSETKLRVNTAPI